LDLWKVKAKSQCSREKRGAVQKKLRSKLIQEGQPVIFAGLTTHDKQTYLLRKGEKNTRGEHIISRRRIKGRTSGRSNKRGRASKGKEKLGKPRRRKTGGKRVKQMRYCEETRGHCGAPREKNILKKRERENRMIEKRV